MSKKQNTTEEATTWVDNFLAKSWVKTTGVCFKATARVVMVLAPAMLSAYLITKYNDKIVVGLGVASGLYAFVNLAKTAYKAECSNKKR